MITASLCLALAVYYEARGEPVAGQIAVAQVVMNRVESHAYPDTVCGVVTQPYQFSFFNSQKNTNVDQRINRLVHKITDKKSWSQSQYIAKAILQGHDTGLTALFYHAETVSPYWSKSPKLRRVAAIGNHIFYSERG